MAKKRFRQHRGVALGRVLRILNILEPRRYGASVEELVDETGYTKRTIYRDLKTLSDQVVLERVHVDRKIHYRLHKDYRAPKIMLTPSELISLYFARSLLKPLDGTPFYTGIESAIEKVKASMPEGAGGLDVADTYFTKVYPMVDYRNQHHLMTTLLQACMDQKKLRAEYTPRWSNETSTHIFHPYLFNYVNGLLYCIGYSEQRKAIRTLAIDRIKSAVILKEEFEIPQHIDPKKHVEESFGIMHNGEPVEVRIEFVRQVAPLIKERLWHPSQKLREHKDGRLELTMRVSGLEDVLYWVLRFGSEAKVLAPPELVEQVRKHAEAMIKAYSS